jgi:putative peptide zinc metalloprotease protein
MSVMNPDAIPVPARLRIDLRWSPYANDRPDMWVAHDPIHREYYFFSSLEKVIASCLDGNHSVDAIVQKSRRLDDAVSASFVRNLIRRLDQASLLLHRNWRHSPRLDQSSSRLWIAGIQSAFAFRIPLFNPSRVVAVLEPVGRVLFSRWLLWFLPVIVSLCLVLLANRYVALSEDLLSLQSGMHGDRLLLAACLLVVIKGIHELGHALASKAVGADCREIGLLFFLGAPCLYCDVSDTWRVPNRWKRCVVSAGGMIVEVWIAILACILWVGSSTPWIRDIALQIMLFSSVVTILFNANPLLRYDGYYILSDGLGVPNLAEQSREAWKELWYNFLFGRRKQATTLRSIALALFHLASSFYRYVLLAALIWGFNHWLFQRRLGNFGVSLTAIFTAVMALAFLTNAWRGLRSLQTNRSSMQSISWFRLSVWGGMSLLMLWVLCNWSFPSYLFARGVIEPGELVPLYARQSAIVQEVQREKEVDDGEILITTVSFELEMKLLQAKGELELAKVRLQQSANRSVNDPNSIQQSGELQETIRATEGRVLKLERELEQLNIRSPGSGRFLEPMMSQTETDLAGRKWGRGSMLGAIAKDRPYVQRGQQIGELARANGWRLRAFVSELDIDECKQGATVFVRLDQWPGVTFPGKVVSVSSENLQRTPKALLGDTLFASTVTGMQSEATPEQASYSVSIDLNLASKIPAANGLASVQIQTKPMTILERWFEMLRRACEAMKQTHV